MRDPLSSEPTAKFVLFIRYGVPILLIVAGFACLAVAPQSSRNEGFALFFGAGVSVLLLNVLHRIGVSGDEDRDRENEAREYFSEHGSWPDEDREAGRRRWNLPENVATPESEAAERERAKERPHPD
jgi:hypothetical protein